MMSAIVRLPSIAAITVFAASSRSISSSVASSIGLSTTGTSMSFGISSRMRIHSSKRRVPSMMIPVTSTCSGIISIVGS